MHNKKRIIIFILILSLVFYLFIPFNESKAVTSVSVTVDPLVITMSAEFHISFVTGKALDSGDWVRVDFPNDFILPCNCGGTGWAAQDFMINGHTPPSKPEGSNTNNQKHITIYIPTGLTINAGSNVDVVIKKSAKVKNPASPGKYKLGVYTSEEGTEVYSQPFNVTLSHIKNVLVFLSSYIVNTTTESRITFKTGELGNLAGLSDSHEQGGLSDSISITFPDEFVVPNFIASEDIRINGKQPPKTRVSSHTIICNIKESIGANSNVIVEIAPKAGIVTPSEKGKYTIRVHTSKEPDDVVSAPVEIKDKPSVKTYLDIVDPSFFPDGLNGFYKTQPLAILRVQSNTGLPVTTYYKIGNGTYQQYDSSPISIPYGVCTVYFYSVSGEIVEKEQHKVIKYDGKAPVITIDSPKDGSSTGEENCLVKGNVKEDFLEAFTINDIPVKVDSQGNFSYTVKLSAGNNIIKLKAVDEAGNTTEKDLRVTYDTTVPQLIITAPSKDWQEFNKPSIDVKGSVIPADNVEVSINGESVSVNSDGEFSYTITPKSEGLVSINVIAEHKISHKSIKKTIIVVYKPVSKTVVILKIGSKEIKINGKSEYIDVAPFIDPSTNRTLVPLRFISEAFGATVKWEPTFKVVTIKLKDKTIKLQVGNKHVLVNGSDMLLDQPPVIVPPGRTMVPLRFISENLGATVEWLPETKEIKITYENG